MRRPVRAPGRKDRHSCRPGAPTRRVWLIDFPRLSHSKARAQAVCRAMKAQEAGRVKRPKTLHRNSVGIQSHPEKASHPRQMGFPGNRGDPQTSVGQSPGKDEPVEQHPGRDPLAFWWVRSETAKANPRYLRATDKGRAGKSVAGVVVGPEYRRKPANGAARSRGVGKGLAQLRNGGEETGKLLRDRKTGARNSNG